MSHLTFDAAICGQLSNVTQPVEIRDPSGKTIGRFIPILDPSEYEGLESPISKEELQRRKQSKGKTYTTAEVLKHLESL